MSFAILLFVNLRGRNLF